MAEAAESRELRILRLASRGRLGKVEFVLLKEALQDPFDGQRLAELARSHGVHPLLHRSLDRVGHPRDRAWRRDLRDAVRRALARNLVLEAELESLAGRLARRRIPLIAARGPRLARELHGSLECRASSGLEIRLREEDAPRVWGSLHDAGFQPASPRTPGATVLHAGRGWPVVLERRGAPFRLTLTVRWGLAVPGQHARVNLPGVWRRSMECSPGHPVRTFCPEDLLLSLAIHGDGRGWSRLSHLSDIQACLARYGSGLRWPVVAARARRWRVADILERALRLSSSLLIFDLPEAAACCLEAGYWPADPLARPEAWMDAGASPARPAAALAVEWTARVRGRRGLRHVAGQAIAGLRPQASDLEALPALAGRPWITWAARPLRIAGQIVSTALRDPAGAPRSSHATTGSRF